MGIIKLIGELDMHSASDLNESINTIRKNNIKLIILNFSKVSFVDSTGLGVILGRYRVIAAENGQILLVGLKPQVKKIFELSGILNVMPLFDDENSAKIYLQKKGGYSFEK